MAHRRQWAVARIAVQICLSAPWSAGVFFTHTKHLGIATKVATRWVIRTARSAIEDLKSAIRVLPDTQSMSQKNWRVGREDGDEHPRPASPFLVPLVNYAEARLCKYLEPTLCIPRGDNSFDNVGCFSARFPCRRVTGKVRPARPRTQCGFVVCADAAAIVLKKNPEEAVPAGRDGWRTCPVRLSRTRST